MTHEPLILERTRFTRSKIWLRRAWFSITRPLIRIFVPVDIRGSAADPSRPVFASRQWNTEIWGFWQIYRYENDSPRGKIDLGVCNQAYAVRRARELGRITYIDTEYAKIFIN